MHTPRTEKTWHICSWQTPWVVMLLLFQSVIIPRVRTQGAASLALGYVLIGLSARFPRNFVPVKWALDGFRRVMGACVRVGRAFSCAFALSERRLRCSSFPRVPLRLPWAMCCWAFSPSPAKVCAGQAGVGWFPARYGCLCPYRAGRFPLFLGEAGANKRKSGMLGMFPVPLWGVWRENIRHPKEFCSVSRGLGGGVRAESPAST